MRIHHLRNATLVIESGNKFILVDPMLGEKSSGLPFSLIRFKAQRNPLVDLPDNSTQILAQVTHCLITHLHPDHLDKDGEDFLKKKNIPVICSVKDEKTLRSKGLNIIHSLEHWKSIPFLEGQITAIPAVHGYGFIAKPMGNVIGFYLELPGDKSIYLSSDTIYTEHVDNVLKEFKPDISVLACGTAQLDIGQPLLMTIADQIRFVKNASGKVIANHLEALNHCPTTRAELKVAFLQNNLQEKVWIPDDGDSMTF